MYAHFTSKYYNKKVQANLHLIETYLPCRLDTAIVVCVMPDSAYKQLYCNYRLTNHGQLQGNYKVYNSTAWK